jgi:hypothetical protein
MLPDGIPPMSGRWVAILRGESALAFPQREVGIGVARAKSP